MFIVLTAVICLAVGFECGLIFGAKIKQHVTTEIAYLRHEIENHFNRGVQ